MEEKVLVVEDDFSNAVAAIAALDEMGVEAFATASAEEAVEMLSKENFLVVLTDMNMPAVKGGSIDSKAGEIVAKECAKKMIPCFVITAGILHHGGTHNIVDILFAHNLYGGAKEPQFDWQQQLRGRQKDVETYKEVWAVIKEIFEPVLAARRRYIKYVLTE